MLRGKDTECPSPVTLNALHFPLNSANAHMASLPIGYVRRRVQATILALLPSISGLELTIVKPVSPGDILNEVTGLVINSIIGGHFVLR